MSGGHERGHPVGARELPQFSGLDLDTIVDEVHRCASAIELETTPQAGTSLEQVRIAASDGSGDLLVTNDGQIRRTSDIQNFLCDGILNRPPVVAWAEVPGQLPAVQLGNLGTQLAVNVTNVTAQSPTTDGQAPRHFDIVLDRPRPLCGQGPEGSIELCRLHVSTRGFEAA